ncbi:MAG: YceD family protein [Actinomycetota bacterium]
MSGFRIDVADLLAHAGTRREVSVAETLTGLGTTAASVPGPVEVSVRLERVPEGIVVRGAVDCRWAGQCSYCLRDLAQPLHLEVAELFEPAPLEGETYPVEGTEIDLEQLVRDTVLLELPLAPHCDEPCRPEADPQAADEISDAPPDPRWAALSELEIR